MPLVFLFESDISSRRGSSRSFFKSTPMLLLVSRDSGLGYCLAGGSRLFFSISFFGERDDDRKEGIFSRSSREMMSEPDCSFPLECSLPAAPITPTQAPVPPTAAPKLLDRHTGTNYWTDIPVPAAAESPTSQQQSTNNNSPLHKSSLQDLSGALPSNSS